MGERKLCIIYDRRWGSMYRHPSERVRENDPNWSRPRFLERIEAEIPTVALDISTGAKNPPADAGVVWFALPDPQPFWIERHYEDWEKKHPGVKLINQPRLLYRTKQLWYYFLNENGIRAPLPNRLNKFEKTEHHGFGPKFGCEFINSVPQNHTGNDTRVPNSSRFHKVWRMVYFDGLCGLSCARLEGNAYWVQTGSAEAVKLMQTPTPEPYRRITEKVGELSGLGYFHIEIIPGSWSGDAVCDVCPHPFDVMEGRLNDGIKDHVLSSLRHYLALESQSESPVVCESCQTEEPVRVFIPTVPEHPTDVAERVVDLPKISCQCITYGRPELLEEAIECFLRQDYEGEKELVILNDHPQQELVFEHPEVRIINRSERFPTVGQKRNACVELCTGSVIFPWDDDDISLPWRISASLKHKGDRPYFKNKRAWLCQNGEIRSEPRRNIYHSMGCWDKALFDAVGGYTAIQSGHDQGIEERFKKHGGRHVEEIPLEEIWYVYRFGGTGHPHLSSYGYGKGWDKIGEVERKKGNERITLRPQWRNDYVAQVEQVRVSLLQGEQEAKAESQAPGVSTGA